MNIDILLTAKTHTGSKSDILLVAPGPAIDFPLSDEGIQLTKSVLHSFIDYFLLQILAAASKSLPFLPEKVDGQPQHLATARQWLNMIESGKQKARCIAWESEGTRYILLATHKE